MIETKRLILRNFEKTDIADVLEYTSNRKLFEMSGWPYLTKDYEIEVLLEYEMKKPYQFAIVLKDSNKVIGNIGLMDIDEKMYDGIKYSKNSKELAFVLSEDYWGKGIMTEAINAVLEFAFKTLDISEILSGNYKENSKSAKIQDKIGLKAIGEIEYFRVLVNKHTKYIQRKITKEEYFKGKLD